VAAVEVQADLTDQVHPERALASRPAVGLQIGHDQM